MHGFEFGTHPKEIDSFHKSLDIDKLDQINPEFCKNLQEALQSDFGDRVLRIILPGAYKVINDSNNNKYISSQKRENILNFIQSDQDTKDYLQRSLDKLQLVIVNNSNAEFINSLMIDDKFSAEAVIFQLKNFLENYENVADVESDEIITFSEGVYAYRNNEGKYVVVNGITENKTFTHIHQIGNYFICSETGYLDDDDFIDGNYYVLNSSGFSFGKINGEFHSGFSLIKEQDYPIIGLYVSSDGCRKVCYYQIFENEVVQLNYQALDKIDEIFEEKIIEHNGEVFMIGNDGRIKKMGLGEGKTNFFFKGDTNDITINNIGYIIHNNILYKIKENFMIKNFAIYKNRKFFRGSPFLNFYEGFAGDMNYSWSQEELEKYFDKVETIDA